MDEDIWSMPRFMTFMGTPQCEPETEQLRAAGARAAFFGAAIETQGFPLRPGTTLGPKVCREASVQYAGGATFEYGIDIGSFWGLVDCGDVSLAGANTERFHERIYKTASAILDAGALPIMCGGDHSIPIPGARALADRVEGQVGYLHIDAHLDNADTIAGGERNTMASGVIRVLEHPRIDPRNVAILGVRGLGNTPTLVATAREMGVHIFPMMDVIDRGIDAVVADALDVIWDGTETVYVSLDNDAIDPGYAPGTTGPEPFGLTSREVLKMACAIGERGVGMLDIAELSPPYDPSDITSRLDCHWIAYILSAYASALEQDEARLPVYARQEGP